MFNLTHKRHGQTTILRCSGRIIFPEADCLGTAVLHLPHTRKLVLDLADVITIDAAGLGALVSLHHWAKKVRTELKVMNVGSWVNSLLEITKLDTLLDSCSVKEMLGFLFCSSDDPAEWLRLSLGPAPDLSCTEASRDLHLTRYR